MATTPALSLEESRGILADQLRKLQAGEITAATANATANLIGKAFYSYKLQLDYHKYIGTIPNLPELAAKPE